MSQYIFFFFFFQAEDGIRDYKVTGVQTCALPISVLLAPQLALDPVPLAPLELAAGVALLLCNGIPGELHDDRDGDRKSTRLNSSHLVISYAVFCLKKKKRDVSA